MKNVSPRIVLCNGADPPQSNWINLSLMVRLEYRESAGRPNIKLTLPNFVLDVFHLPDRILDLLEIAAYVFCADRLTSRGSKDNVSIIAGRGYFTLPLKSEISTFGTLMMSKKNLKKHSFLCPVIGSVSFYLPTWTFNASNEPV